MLGPAEGKGGEGDAVEEFALLDPRDGAAANRREQGGQAEGIKHQRQQIFAKHLGASPSQVAKTTRVQRAKRLLDETDLSMTDIALRSGFRSLRRFNDVFIEVYKRPPSEIRRTRRSPQLRR